MVIEEIQLQNFKSFGAKKQVVSFSNEGELILLCGKNGSAKSAIRDCIDLGLYAKVSGRTRKSLPLAKIPNRINRTGLYTSIKFKNYKNQDIFIQRWINPTKMQIICDNQDITAKYKLWSLEKKEELIGVSYDMFKSFISLTMKDFENFIQLTDTGKNDLLNKLFQLGELITYHSIAKSILTNTQQSIKIQENKIFSIQDELKNLKKIIDAFKSNPQDRLNELKKENLSYKPKYYEIENNIKENKSKYLELCEKSKNASVIMTEHVKKTNSLKLKIENIEEKLSSYNDGICPVCSTNLKENEHIDHKIKLEAELSEKKAELARLNELYNQMVIEDSKYKNQKNSTNQLIINLENQKSNIKSKMFNIKTEYENLSKQYEIIDIEKIKSQYKEIEEEYNHISYKLEENKRKEKIYIRLVEILNGTEIRKNLILKIIEPVNKYLKFFLEKLDSPFNVKLDEQFNAKITDRDDIDPETLSKGEAMIINLSIALSYLCSILDLKHCNLVFLDEVFDGIDVDNVDLIITLLRELALKYKINIIIVHHNLLDNNKFDRIIKVTKKIHSDIEEIKIKN